MHIPVLKEEVLAHLSIQKTDIVIDGTLGLGGHTQEMAKNIGPDGLIIGIDQDEFAVSFCQKKFESDPRIRVYRCNFSECDLLLKKEEKKSADKLLLDLGYSSYQLDEANRGFSFLKSEFLDMRMSLNTPQTAADILNTYSFQDLSNLFFNFAELHQNKRLCQNILDFRIKKKLKSTDELIGLVKKSYVFSNRKIMMKILSQIFQALRIEVNQEFKHLQKLLAKLSTVLSDNGIAAIISFHSGEDRLIKSFLKENKSHYHILSKSVIQASKEEKLENPRSKPAKLRVFQKRLIEKKWNQNHREKNLNKKQLTT